jgi:ABC-type nitrate/sulfonate/bicarbonate transport system substrate-binding protein
MIMSIRLRLLLIPILMTVFFPVPASSAADEVLVAYGGHNETMAPMWVGVDRGLFRKHGIDPRVLQTRSGPIMMATWRRAELLWSGRRRPAPSARRWEE